MAKYIAHRGLWNDLLLPNSYEALLNGLNSAKYIGIETDVRVTKDGVFIIYHDALYKGRLVRNIYYKDIKRDVCKLEDVLKIKTNKVIMLEIKDFYMNVRRFIKLLNKYQRDIYIMSFDTKVIEKIAKLNTKYKLGVLNYILNSDYNYHYDFICLLDLIASKEVIASFHKRNIMVIIYGVIKVNGDLTYIIDDYKLSID